MFTFVKIYREIILEKVSNDNLCKKYGFFGEKSRVNAKKIK